MLNFMKRIVTGTSDKRGVYYSPKDYAKIENNERISPLESNIGVYGFVRLEVEVEYFLKDIKDMNARQQILKDSIDTINLKIYSEVVERLHEILIDVNDYKTYEAASKIRGLIWDIRNG